MPKGKSRMTCLTYCEVYKVVDSELAVRAEDINAQGRIKQELYS